MEYSPEEEAILKQYVTNTSDSIFVLRNLPEVIKGALFSRYSRSTLGLRELLLKEFLLSKESAFSSIKPSDTPVDEDRVAVKKAQDFYDRILDGYGDDSIGELGGAHLAIENISMLAAKAIEDARIGGSPLEKSTRYIFFDQMVNGEYLFYREPILMTSAYRDLYVNTCNLLFSTYSKLIPPLTEKLSASFPHDPSISKAAYNAALRAKVLDCLRGLLPASCMTNMGLYGNGRFFESLLQKLNAHNLAEMQEIGKKSHQELSHVISSFVRRADVAHRHQESFASFTEKMTQELKLLAQEFSNSLPSLEDTACVRLIQYDPDSPTKVASALLFAHSQSGLFEIQEFCKQLPDEEIHRILEVAAHSRENRRHKSPRALEHASFTFEIVADFGVYRDLQRHRMLTQEKQMLGCRLGYYVPDEIKGTDLEREYRSAMDLAKQAFDTIQAELPEEAQYVVPMGYNIHWYFHINLRSLQWLCELRSSAAGHPSYRLIAQELAKQVSHVLPAFERFFKFVDYEGYQLGRLGQEIRTIQKLQARAMEL